MKVQQFNKLKIHLLWTAAHVCVRKHFSLCSRASGCTGATSSFATLHAACKIRLLAPEAIKTNIFRRLWLTLLAVCCKRDFRHIWSEAGSHLTNLTPLIELRRSDQMQPDHCTVLTTVAWLLGYERMDAANTCNVFRLTISIVRGKTKSNVLHVHNKNRQNSNMHP